jgi:putative endonuclease
MRKRVGSEPTSNKPAADPERQIAFRFGISAESRAAAYLMAKGYRVVARRFKTPVGEIDIVARRGGALYFVEVKARETFDDAAEAVTPKNRRRIIAAAEAWLAKNPQDVTREMRFDVVLVIPGRLPQHIAGAFDASE